ncbi:MAG TPA: efflux RND transporter permease subunit, partial [Candidatus Dormibacteraeota bacterium]|nr:efflux RND transporter permease subunit [Candidatus Dormibacteraeota bacterium]
MNLSALFVRRPIATTLLTMGVALAGILALLRLPVSPLPQVDFPTISVQASQPGASPAVMATSVATPLERYLGTIANVTEMTSSSSLGSTRITLQFGLDRDINGAARDVQAAINAAHADLPSSLRSNPTYRKVNPADAPIMILALTSTTLSQGQLYDAAASILQQKLSQVSGVGQVDLGGSSLPAVRVELEPRALFRYGIGLEDVRAAIAAANANSPKGSIEAGNRHYQLYTNDQARKADQYRGLVIAYRNGAAVRLADVGEVVDSVEDLRNQGLANGKPSVLVIISREPGANIIDTVDRVKELLPQLQASIPAGAELTVASDRTTTIRASLRDVEYTLVMAIALVILVVFLFLRSPRATLIPGVAVPISLLGTLGVMYLLGYSINNLSLMALTIATGFVVDDAIVMIENVVRYIEQGMRPLEAAYRGAAQIGFTIVSLTVSLIAVFIPLLFMTGVVGRLFKEFAVTLSVAVVVSAVISLTLTPMMCGRILRPAREEHPGRIARISEAGFNAMLAGYRRSLPWTFGHHRLVLVVAAATLAGTIGLYIVVPKGF